MPILDHLGCSGCGWRAKTSAILFLLGTAFMVVPDARLLAQERAVADAVLDTSYDRHIAAAARRFGLPAAWIRAVIHVESAGDPRAVSSAGAMGLMQIMPGTWADLRGRYRLGTDPFYPRDNITAGTAYLREMYDRFGSPGFLAAYNAGPGRYAEHLATGRRLPRETREYIAKVVALLRSDRSLEAGSNAHNEADWRTADIFYSPADTVAEGDSSPDAAGDRDAADASSPTPAAPFVGTNLGLFVVPRSAENAP
jgi:hypothetical protein